MVIQEEQRVNSNNNSLTALLLRCLFLALFALNCVVHFPAMNRYTLRGRYAETNLVPTDVDNSNLDIIANHNRLIFLPA